MEGNWSRSRPLFTAEFNDERFINHHDMNAQRFSVKSIFANIDRRFNKKQKHSLFFKFQCLTGLVPAEETKEDYVSMTLILIHLLKLGK